MPVQSHLELPKVNESNEKTSTKECPNSKRDYEKGEYSEPNLKKKEVGMVMPQEEKPVPKVDKKNDKNDE